MSSPAKRRKKNDYKASPSTTRSLDYFFGKQQSSSARKATNFDTTSRRLAATSESSFEFPSGAELTDEEFARQLQEQWNRDESLEAGRSLEIVNDKAESQSHRHDESSIASGTGDAGDQLDSAADQSTKEITESGNLPASAQASQDDDPRAVAKMEQESTTVVPTHLATNESTNITRQAQIPVPSSLSLQTTASAEDEISSTIPFDDSPLTFQAARYVSELRKHWSTDDGAASYSVLTRCFILVNSTQSRIKIVDTLVNFLRVIIEADPESLLPAVWLATNSIAPPFISMELGIGGSAISKALKQVCGLDSQGLKTLYNKHGDPGDVAYEAKKRQSFMLRKPKPLTIKGVYQALVKTANSKGNGSQETKQRIVERLLQDARGPEESRYIMRTLAQHLRIGAVKTTMLIALSRAFMLSQPPGSTFPVHSGVELASLKKEDLVELYADGEEILKSCYARRPDYNILVPSLLEVGVCQELRLRCGLALHVPLLPMLGSITRDLNEMLTKLQGRDFSCEFKYDGQRAQVHCDERGKVSIFSRHLENMTEKYPDLVTLVPKFRGEGVASFVMEGEVVAIDRESGDLKTFQTLAGRGRKDVVISSLKVDVCLFAFDLMYLNGEDLLSRSFRERRELLRSMFVEIPRHFTWVRSIDASSVESETVLEFFKSATDVKCEGIMVKVLDNLPRTTVGDIFNEGGLGTRGIEPSSSSAAQSTVVDDEPGVSKSARERTGKAKEKGSSRRKALLATYEPDKRLDSWLKVKKDYDTTAFDTIDLIPVAAWHGQGRKSKWWSPILLAARNPETGSLEAVCKCISGFSDKFYAENKERYDVDGPNIHRSRPAYVEYVGGVPDIWFEPQEVWEVAFADITISPTYTAALGLVHDHRGLSLRFPRFLKKRDDKSIDEGSTTDFLATLYRKQDLKISVLDSESYV